MFTIKVLRPSLTAKTSDARDEQIFEAREISYNGNFIIICNDADAQPLFLGRSGYLMSLHDMESCGQQTREPEPQPQRSNVSIYIMNRFGATVATYQF